MISLKLTGEEDIDKVLKGLPGVFQDKVVTRAHEKAAKPLVDRAHYLAPVYETGNLAESIGVVKAKAQIVGRGELGAINIGPRRKSGYKGFAGHLVEYGTKPRQDKKGANRGRVTGKKFMEPAWEQTKGEVQERTRVELGRDTYNFMKRTIKKSR